MMIIGGGIGYAFSRWAISTSYLVEALSQRVGYDYDNEGQVIIYTGQYDHAEAQ